MRKMLSVLSLYRYHPVVYVLGISLAVVMVAVKLFLEHNYYFMGEELMTVWLIIWMSLSFQMGIMIKRQMATPAAHLLPGYRIAHAAVAFLILSVIAVLTLPWLISLFKPLSPAKAQWYLATLTLGSFFLTMIVAYISMRVVVLISYAVLLISASYVMAILDIFVEMPLLADIVMAAAALLPLIFLWRMIILKEESLEYPFLFSWPFYKSQTGERAKYTLYEKKAIPAFHTIGSSFNKAMHWIRLESEDLGSLGAVLVVAVLVFEIYILKFAPENAFYTHPYANLFLLVMLPVFISLCFNYRLMAFKDWALILPISRSELAKQWGVLMAVCFVSSWILVFVLFAVVPDLLLGLGFLKTFKMWEYLVFTGVFGLMTIGFLAYISLLQHPRKVITYIFVYGVYVSAEYMLVAWFDETVMLGHILLAVAVGILFSKKTYDQWCGNTP